MSTLKNKNYYEILEIDRTCSQEDISEAYRNLSLKYHPQKATQEKKEVYELHFQKLSEAYEVLSDPTKKEFMIYMVLRVFARESWTKMAMSKELINF